MFIHIENHIINIQEIRNIINENIGRGKYCIKIFLKNAEHYDYLSLQNKTADEAEAIMAQLAKACLNFGSKK